MTRLSNLFWMLVIVIATFSLYLVKYRVQTMHRQIAETTRQLEIEKHSFHVVAAEWSYLNRPERIQYLAEKYLTAKDVTADQVAEVEAVPMRGKSYAATSSDAIRPVSARVGGFTPVALHEEGE